MGQEVCIDGQYQGCNVRQPSVEVCDHIDNDCDGRVDEETQIGQECLASVLNCAGTFPGSYSCLSGAPVCEPNPDFLPTPDRPEVCDGLDNNCDGVVDNHSYLGLACAGEFDQACAYSAYVCPEVEMLGREREIICELDEIPPEECDTLDNDCDGLVDEGQVCGQLIYQNCSVSLGFARITYEVAPAPWPQFPPSDAQTCNFGEQRNEGTYTCNTATANSNFRALNIAHNGLGWNDWLGIAWECDARDPMALSETERGVLRWARDHCHVALGYRDYRDADGVLNLQVATCPAMSQFSDSSQFSPRCTQTMIPSQYSAIELEGGINGDDKFAVAFYCDTVSESEQIAPEIDRALLAEHIQNEFSVFVTTYQGGDLYIDGANTWGDLPAQDLDDDGRSRGAGSTANGGFSLFDLSWVGPIDQFGIYTRVR
jgi:hypothetical protein